MSNATKTSAMDRINALLDDNSFVEIGAAVTKRNTDFNLREKSAPADGVITGYGVIDCNPVYLYSQDAGALGGSIGEMHSKKIAGIYNLALKTGTPMIGLIDCAGIRLEEATDALAGFGEMYLKQAMASGVIPQISAIFGTCGGGVAVSANMSDFTFMPKKDARLFVNSPNALECNHIGKCDTSSAAFQAEAGNVDFLCEDEADVLSRIRTLVTLLPLNNEDDASCEECGDDLNRMTEELDALVTDPAKALEAVSDNHFFLEVKKDYAKDMVTGFIRLNGMTVGAVANRTELLGEDFKAVEKYEASLSAKGCYKAEKFVKICDSFNIPVLTFTNVAGYKAEVQEEKAIGTAAAKLTYAFANATVPKVNVIVGKAFGSAYITMNSKHIGADLVFALPQARIGTMDANAAAAIIYSEEAKSAADAAAFLKEKAASYDELQSSADAAARRGYVDNIVEAGSMRKNLVYAYEMLFTKRENRPDKKHGTI